MHYKTKAVLYSNLMGKHDGVVEIMFQINKLTDYAVHVLSALRDANDTCQSATLISQATSVPVTTVSKCLKLLALASLVESCLLYTSDAADE